MIPVLFWQSKVELAGSENVEALTCIDLVHTMPAPIKYIQNIKKSNFFG
jgi:hypothetical protein